MKSYDWDIHLVSDVSSNDQNVFYDYMCDAHTHGLEQFGSRELQIVVFINPETIGYIMNVIGERIKDGLLLHEGDVIEDLFKDKRAKIKVVDATDCKGQKVWRLVLPDQDFKFPEESQQYPYYMQTESPYIPEMKPS